MKITSDNACHPVVRIHSLLDNGPFSFLGYNKRVQIKLKSVLYSRIIYFSRKFTVTDQFIAFSPVLEAIQVAPVGFAVRNFPVHHIHIHLILPNAY